jgi:excisionase family DNA binding protein
MIEFNDIVVAINRLREKIIELASKIDHLSKSPSPMLKSKYIENSDACRILCMSKRTLARMRSEGTIPYIKLRRRILYHAADLHEYLESKCKKTGSS